MALLTVPVASFTSRGVYTVDLARRSCTCPSFAFRCMPCKHMTYVQRMASGLTELPTSGLPTAGLPTARTSPEHVIPMPSSTSDNVWYAVDYVNKTCTCAGFQHRRQCKHVEDSLELEILFRNETIRIPSYSDDGTWYTVDLDLRTCTCPFFVNRRVECKHIEDSLELKRMFGYYEDSSEPENEEPEDSEMESDSDSVLGGIYEDSDSEPEVTSRQYPSSDSDSCASDATWYPDDEY